MSTDRPIADFVPPTVPQNLKVVAVSERGLDLAWDASTDNVGVAGYEVSYKDEQTAQTVKTEKTSLSLGSLTPATEYTIRVRAYDAFGNHSFWSTPVTATTG